MNQQSLDQMIFRLDRLHSDLGRLTREVTEMRRELEFWRATHRPPQEHPEEQAFAAHPGNVQDDLHDVVRGEREAMGTHPAVLHPPTD